MGVAPKHLMEEMQFAEKKLMQAAIQLENLEERMIKTIKEARRCELTKTEVETIEESVPMYAQYGRCFLQQNKSDLQDELAKATTKYRAVVKKTKDSQEYFERQR